MKSTVNSSDFVDAFKRIRPDQFSYSGLKALFTYLEEIEESQGSEMELDVIALCCDFSEYATALEAAKTCDFEPEEGDDADAQEKAALEWLNEQTQVIPHKSGIIIASF